MKFNFPEDATPLDDHSDLLIPWVQNMRDLNRVEAENILSAQRKYLRTAKNVSTWFHIREFQTIHRSMFGHVWAWAGKIRSAGKSIGVSPNFILNGIATLCEEVLSWESEPVELTFLEKSARIHHRLVAIHPFENGNGRFSRLVGDRYLKSWNCPYPIWPDQLHQGGTSRRRYINALQKADRGNYHDLLALMYEFGGRDPTLANLFQKNCFTRNLSHLQITAKIRSFLRLGINPNDLSEEGEGVLQSVIKSQIDKKAILLKLLIEHGADVNLVDKKGLSPLKLAQNLKIDEIEKFLTSQGGK